MLMKLLIAAYPILIFILIALFFSYFKIRKHLPVNVPDVVTVFLIIGLHLFSRQVTQISILPYYLILISSMALVLLLLDLFYYRHFRPKQFVRFFWRVTFFITLLLYICMVYIILTH